MGSTVYGAIFSDKFCRACLSTGSKAIFFELGLLSRFFTDHLNIEANESDACCVCSRCAHIITKTLSFGDRVVRADAIIRQAARVTRRKNEVNIKYLSRKRALLGFETLSNHISTDIIEVQHDYNIQSQVNENVLEEGVKTEQFDGGNLDNAEFSSARNQPQNDSVVDEISIDYTEQCNGDEVADTEVRHMSKKNLDVSDKIAVITLTMDEAFAEQSRLAEVKTYLNSLYKCTLCYKGLATLQTYNTHMESHSEKFGTHKCEICHRYSRSLTSHKLHVGNHTKRYRCKRCGQQGISRDGILRHYSVAHEKNCHMPCQTCGRVFRNAYLLQHHVRYTHRKKQACDCEHCGKSFANKCSLRQHCIRKHSADLPEGSRRHVCAVCGHKFLDVTNLREHMAKHSSLRQFYCADCDVGFKTMLALQTHLKCTLKHADPEKLISCQQCPLRFADNRLLLRHVRDNHRTTSFKCPLCPKEYGGRAQLRTHTRFAHEGHTLKRKYVCHVCGRAFAYKPVMMDHMNTHTGSRPHKCTECPSDFANAAALYRHKKLVHLQNKKIHKNV